METQKSGFNRILLIAVIVLYVLTVTAFTLTNLAADPGFEVGWVMLLNILILSIPLVLLYGSLYLLIVAWREHHNSGQINPRLSKVIHWAPRIAAILIIFFTSLFSLDIFEMEVSPLELLVGFLIHNIPSITMIVLLILAWKRPVVGFVAFLAVAALFTLVFVRDLYTLPNLLLFAFPMLLIAGLFYADWKWLQPQLPGRIDAAA